MRNSAFRVEEWLVEPELNQLSNDTGTISIEPQAMAVLVMLAEHAGESVSTEDLIREVWGGRPMADNPLYKVITKLRQAFDDDARNPHYIETISKKGYRLLPAVKAVAAGTRSGEPGAKRTLWALAAACIAIAVTFISFYWPATLPSQPALARLVTLPGSNYAPALSSDHKTLAFINRRGSKTKLWLLEFATGELRPLDRAGGDVQAPAWQPGSNALTYVSQGAIWLLNTAAGSAPIRLIDHATYPAWSPDGETLVFERGSEVWLARGDGLGQRRVAEIESREQVFAPKRPQFSPDGRLIAFFDANQGPIGHIKVFDLDSRSVRQITQTPSQAGGITFSQDGEDVLYHAPSRGRVALWQMPVSGTAPARVVIQGTSDDRDPLVTNRGLIYTTTREKFELVLTDFTNDSEQVLYDSRYAIVAPELSPDGDQIAFFGLTHDSGMNVFVMDQTDVVPTQVTQGAGNSVMPHWGGDQTTLHYYFSADDFRYERVSIKTGDVELLLADANFNQQHDISVSHDGKYALYALVERENVLDTLLVDLDSGAEQSLQRKLSWFDWSQDGQRFLATDFSNHRLPVGTIVLCKLAGGTVGCEQLADRGQHPVWTANEDGMLFVDPIGADIVVKKIDIQTKQETRVGVLGPTVGYGPFIDVSRDGRLVWVRYRAGDVELWSANFK